METDRGPYSAFSYLTLGPLVVERLLERESTIVRTEGSDRPETTEELRVRHLLRGEPTVRETDRSASSDPSVPIREATVLGTATPEEVTSDDRTDPPAETIRNVTVLGRQDLTVLERVDTETPPASNRGVDPTPDRTGTPPPRGDGLTVQVTPRPDEPPTLSPTTTVTNVTETTVRRSSPIRPASRPESLPPGEERTSERPATASPGRGSHNRSENRDDTASGVRTTLASQERPLSEPSPELTVVTARPATESDGTRRPATQGEREHGPVLRNGSPLDEDRTQRMAPPKQPPVNTTMTTLLDDTTEMNRLVDRLYREFQRKERIERERRGL